MYVTGMTLKFQNPSIHITDIKRTSGVVDLMTQSLVLDTADLSDGHICQELSKSNFKLSQIKKFHTVNLTLTLVLRVL